MVVTTAAKSKKRGHFVLKIMPGINKAVFKLARLTPNRDNLRDQQQSGLNEKGQQLGSAHYNNLILEDMFLLDHLKMIHQHSRTAPNLVEAIMLLKTWLRQRKLDHQHSFSGFHLSLFMAHLFSERAINKQMSSYQLFKLCLDKLCKIDSSQPLLLSSKMLEPLELKESPQIQLDQVALIKSAFEICMVSPEGKLVVTSRVTRPAFEELIYEAKTALLILSTGGDYSSLAFEKLFLVAVDQVLKFDQFFMATLGSKNAGDIQNGSQIPGSDAIDTLYSISNSLSSVLSRGLGNRVLLVATRSPPVREWQLHTTSQQEQERLCSEGRWIYVGVILDQNNAFRVVDHGPAADQKEAGDIFRSFWGSKAELRRFKDGSIREAVVWTNELEKAGGFDRRHVIIRNIIEYLMQTHFQIGCKSLFYISAQLDSLLFDLPSMKVSKKQNKKHTMEMQSATQMVSFSNASARVIQEFDSFANQLRSIIDPSMPLAIRSVLPLHTAFRYTHWHVIQPHPILLKGKQEDEDSEEEKEQPLHSAENLFVEPLGVLLEFEKSSKWPTDFEAIQSIKAAFYIQLSRMIKKHLQVECIPTARHLDVFFGGYTFRVLIRADKELNLTRSAEETIRLRRKLKLKPKHTTLINGFHLKNPVFGPTCRLVKRWLASHLFLPCCLREEAVELMVLYLFLSPLPYHAPTSPITGFLRFLHMLATFDFENEPLVVDVFGEITNNPAISQQIADNFRHYRQQSVEMESAATIFIMFSKDITAPVWTAGKPSWMDLRRMIQLATVTLQAVSTGLCIDNRLGLVVDSKTNHKANPVAFRLLSLWKSWKSFFQTPLSDFDVLIKLHDDLVPEISRSAVMNQPLVEWSVSHSSEMSGPEATTSGKRRRQHQSLFEIPQFRNLALSKGHSSLFIGFNPVKKFVKELKSRYGHSALIYYNKFGGNMIALVWRPSAWLPKPFNAKSAQNAILLPQPLHKEEEEEEEVISGMVIPNIFEILADIRSLGSGLVEDILFPSSLPTGN